MFAEYEKITKDKENERKRYLAYAKMQESLQKKTGKDKKHDEV